jgi:hypothetical protein
LTFPPKNPIVVVIAPNPEIIQTIANLLIKNQPINIGNNFTPNPSKHITKNLTRSLPKPIKLPLLSPNRNLTLKPLLVTNMDRKDIHPVSVKLIPNYMNSN